MPLEKRDYDQDFVLVGEQDTVAEALASLQAESGRDAWHIFVRQTDGKIGVLKVAELKRLLEKLGPALFEKSFVQLQARIDETRTAEKDRIGVGTAERWAQAEPSGVLVILESGEVVGRLYQATELGADPFPGSTMSQLYGDYINTHQDLRADWQAAGREEPICPHCGFQGYFRYDVGADAFVCKQCHEETDEGQ